MTDTSCELLGEFFATFAYGTRMKIMCALQQEPKTVTEIAAIAGISIPNASQHLRLMRDRGAVLSDKQGQSVFYRIADQRIVQAMVMIRQALSEHLFQNAARTATQPDRRASQNILETL